MAVAPMPKQRSMLQRGRFPRNAYSHQDPDEPIGVVDIHRACVNGNPGAVPSEAFQYDLVYIAFRNDEDFWDHWKVVECARCSVEESISQKNAYIRVVMDLPKEVKLYPTAYTPGFPTVPRNVSAKAKAKNKPKIPGLPDGYSVALDVYILEDASILLEHQRSFRGRVDPKYRWLDEIVNKDRNKGYTEETLSGELAMIEVTPMDSTVVYKTDTNKHWTWHSGHLPKQSDLHSVLQPAASDVLPLSCFHACPRGLDKGTTREYTCIVEQSSADLYIVLGDFARKHELTPHTSSVQGYGKNDEPIVAPLSDRIWARHDLMPFKFVWSMEARENPAFLINDHGEIVSEADHDTWRNKTYKPQVKYELIVDFAHKRNMVGTAREFEKGLQVPDEDGHLIAQECYMWCFDQQGKPVNVSQPPPETDRNDKPLWPVTFVWRDLAHMSKVHADKIRQKRRRQIHEEQTLINAFGDHVGLPKRDMGTWGRVEDGSASARKNALEEETRILDQKLEALKAKTHSQTIANV